MYYDPVPTFILYTLKYFNSYIMIPCINSKHHKFSGKVYEAMALSMTSPRPLDPTDPQLESTPLLICKYEI